MWLPTRMGYEPTASMHAPSADPSPTGPGETTADPDGLEGDAPLDLDDLEGDEPLNLDDLEGEDGALNLDDLEAEDEGGPLSLDDLEEELGDRVPIVVASAGLDALEGGHDHEGEDADHADEQHAADDLVTAPGDPHFWLSVPNAVRYVENIRDGLAAADPDHAEGYQSRAEEFIAELQALDAEVRSTLEAIPAEARKIVVFHDAYEYLAHEYGFEVAAAVAPANPNQETSAQAIAAIVDEVRGVTHGVDGIE